MQTEIASNPLAYVVFIVVIVLLAEIVKQLLNAGLSKTRNNMKENRKQYIAILLIVIAGLLFVFTNPLASFFSVSSTTIFLLCIIAFILGLVLL